MPEGKDHWYGDLKCDVTAEDVVDARGRYVTSFLCGIGGRLACERKQLRDEVIKRCNLFPELVAAVELLDKKKDFDKLLKKAAANAYKQPPPSLIEKSTKAKKEAGVY